MFNGSTLGSARLVRILLHWNWNFLFAAFVAQNSVGVKRAHELMGNSAEQMSNIWWMGIVQIYEKNFFYF